MSTVQSVKSYYIYTALRAWAPGDYENWEGTLIKMGGHNINLGGGHQWSKLKILHLPHKIWGARAPPPVPYTPGAHA